MVLHVGFGDEVGVKARELEALSRSVIVPRRSTHVTAVPGMDPISFMVANAGELITPWGGKPKARDQQLRSFWMSEDWLSTTVGIISARNAALEWEISGDEQTAIAAQEMINNANFGGGWEEFITQTSIDLYTQDSGAFVELIRAGDSETAPVIGISHLDAARCWPTGVPEMPVIYEATDGQFRAMPWYSVIQLLEMPDPRTFTNTGFFYKLQHCAVSRLLRSAQILKNVAIYKEEKTGGRFTRGIHLIAGFTMEEIAAGLNRTQSNNDAAGLRRFTQTPIIASVNPEQQIDHKLLEIAGLPDGFDEAETIKNYITLLANAFGTDYQEIAPLPGGNLGTSTQSETLHMKSRGKGVGYFMKLVTRMMNHTGILPDNVQFAYTEPDIEAEEQEAEIEKKRAEGRKLRIDSGELLLSEARQIAVEDGDLPMELLDANAEFFDENDIRAREDQQAQAQAARMMKPEETVTGDEQARSRDDDATIREGERAMGPVTFGKLLSSRLHRAYSTTSDDVHGLGYFEDTARRVEVASLIGPVLAKLEADMKRSGLWDIELEPEDADRIVDIGMREMVAGIKEERAGPDAERLEYEDDLAARIHRGLGRAEKLLEQRVLVHAGTNGTS